MPLLSSLWAVGLSLLIPLVQAKLPLSSSGPRARLKEEEGVTFDPLGVAAVLHNPRVDTSAAMLYIQYDRGLFTWPHTTMIGGALPPMKMLLDHLTADVRSIHPAIKMCATHTTWLPVRSDVSGNVFHKLPLNVTTLWLRDVVAFRTSELPVNDFAVVYVDAIHEPLDVRRRRVKERMGAVRWRMAKWTLDLIGLLNGMLLLTGMVFGILVADLWAFTLFFFYGCHWAASLLVSIRPVILIHKPPIKEDATVRYAVYEREEGGTVIFKGPQDKLEEWARCTWKYQSGFIPTCLHWSWMVTGTLAGIASVACMVNMRGYMQLAFLAVLIYSSVAEILAIRISRSLQTNAKGRIFHSTVLRNKQRTEAIIRATLQIEPKCRLQGLDWIKMRLLPPMDIFKNMQTLLAQINKMQDDEQDGTSQLDPDARNQLLESLFNEFVDGAGPLRSLAQRIVGEMKAALEDSWFADAGKDARAGGEKQVPVFHA